MDAVEDIKQRLNIEDVIGEYVQLKRAGRNWKGLSPFGNEKTPSFMVSPEKQIWHDFSSGKGGSMFDFVMEMEGLDFKGALELLARKAGIDLTQYQRRSGTSAGLDKDRLYAALELATKFYQTQLKSNPPALEYLLHSRQFSKQTALTWRLGYSSEAPSALTDFLLRRGFSETELKNAGLSVVRYLGLGDMFRGRIMIPLCDAQGRVIGFTARLLKNDADAPKYINTPQTRLYDKSRHIFGLHLAKEAIRREGFVVVAEGNLDVITSHQANVAQVVATAGTALTVEHLKGLARFTPDIRLCFDADKAGLNATERAIPLASKIGASLSIITLPAAKDPDELIKQNPAAWQTAIQQPEYALDWLINRYLKQLDVATAAGKRKFSDILLPVVAGLDDAVEKEHYLRQIAAQIQVSQEALESKLGRQQNQARPKATKLGKKPVQTNDQKQLERIKIQNHLLSLLLGLPELRGLLATMHEVMLPEENARQLVKLLKQQPAVTVEQALAWQPLTDYVKMLSLLFEELYQDVEATELSFEAARLQRRLIEQYVKIQKQRLSQLLQQTTDEAQVTKLLEKAKALDQLLKS